MGVSNLIDGVGKPFSVRPAADDDLIYCLLCLLNLTYSIIYQANTVLCTIISTSPYFQRICFITKIIIVFSNHASIKPLLPQNSLVAETPMPLKTIYSLSNISQRNTVRIHTNEQNLRDRKDIVIKQNKRPRSYDALNENGNVMLRNRRNLITTNENFTEKFSYGNIIPTTAKLPESAATLQTANSPKPVTSLLTINPLKPMAPNGTEVTR